MCIQLTFAEQDEGVGQTSVGLLRGQGLVNVMLQLHLKLPSRRDHLQTEWYFLTGFGFRRMGDPGKYRQYL